MNNTLGQLQTQITKTPTQMDKEQIHEERDREDVDSSSRLGVTYKVEEEIY